MNRGASLPASCLTTKMLVSLRSCTFIHGNRKIGKLVSQHGEAGGGRGKVRFRGKPLAVGA